MREKEWKYPAECQQNTYCFKMGRYLKNKVEERVRKGVEIQMMPEKRSGSDAQGIQWEEK